MGMENVKELLVILIGSSLVSNVVLSQFLGLCPFLGVSRKTNTAAGMGAAVIFVITLASAVDKFDPGKGIKFETYVSKRIRGAVIDLARRQDWVPRSVRRKARDIDQASSELFAELGRYPTDQEMAQRLGITQDQYQEDLANSSMCNVLSLDALFEDREQNGGAEVPDGAADSRPEDSMLRQELLDTLTKAIESLRENEQTVISLYYHKNLSMKEIAQVMEVSEPRISQLHSRAIQKLKLYMNQYMTGM